MKYIPTSKRYSAMQFNRCGKSGLMLPAISLGLWHNFGHVDKPETYRSIMHAAFDAGITHFDLANNYGPPPGSAEENFGRILNQDFQSYRDEMIISTKAGYLMWPGPYGDFGSRKYLLGSLDQSLKRMGLDYVDIFYHHRPDPETPIEETMSTLDNLVRSGKSLYVGISQYSADETKMASKILRELGTPCLIHQPNYSILDRWIENKLLDVLAKEGIGCIVFSPLAQGILTNRYLSGIPDNSRAAREGTNLDRGDLTKEILQKTQKLNEIAKLRNQTLAQMSIAWVMKKPVITSALIGASSVQQIKDNINALKNRTFSIEELKNIDEIITA
ncbi:MAG: L-glyceraldehyde 3-phosphate reductase [Bacteroidales bacterium]|nr:L-glyceraldehyde 3-phosphate reductase [Bacteroidales bacterium]